jgi:hypothetical protein
MKNANPITPVSNVIELRRKSHKPLFSKEGLVAICFQHVKIKSLKLNHIAPVSEEMPFVGA